MAYLLPLSPSGMGCYHTTSVATILATGQGGTDCDRQQARRAREHDRHRRGNSPSPASASPSRECGSDDPHATSPGRPRAGADRRRSRAARHRRLHRHVERGVRRHPLPRARAGLRLHDAVRRGDGDWSILNAIGAILTGQATTVACLYGAAISDGRARRADGTKGGYGTFAYGYPRLYGFIGAGMTHALHAQRHMHRYGTTSRAPRRGCGHPASARRGATGHPRLRAADHARRPPGVADGRRAVPSPRLLP